MKLVLKACIAVGFLTMVSTGTASAQWDITKNIKKVKDRVSEQLLDEQAEKEKADNTDSNDLVGAIGTSSAFYLSTKAMRIKMVDAEMSFAEAFELNEQVELLKAEKARLEQGSVTSKGLKDSLKVSSSTQKAIKQKIDEGHTLSEKQVPMFASAKQSMLESFLLFIPVHESYQGWRSSLDQKRKSSNFAEKISAGKELVEFGLVAKEMAPWTVSTFKTFKLASSFGETQGIPPQKDETEILEKMSGLGGF